MSGTAAVMMNLEVQIVPVSDVDRAKGFYERLGWRLDDDVAPIEGLRIVQFTPPGSGTSISFGQGLTTATPGSGGGTLVVSDREAAHAALANRGIVVADVWHAPFLVKVRQPGVDLDRTSYGSFCSFTDPDGNLWIIQEVTHAARSPRQLGGRERGSPGGRASPSRGRARDHMLSESHHVPESRGAKRAPGTCAALSVDAGPRISLGRSPRVGAGVPPPAGPGGL